MLQGAASTSGIMHHANGCVVRFLWLHMCRVRPACGGRRHEFVNVELGFWCAPVGGLHSKSEPRLAGWMTMRWLC